MVVVVRVLLRVLLLTAAVYACLVGIAALMAPGSSEPQTVDTASAGSTLYATSTKYLMFMQPALRMPGRRVIVLGASNADIELRPQVLGETVKCATIDNLSIGNENITELDETARIALQNRRYAHASSDVYVLGVWFGLFGDSKARWNGPTRENNESDIDLEFQRYGTYKKGGDFYESRFGVAYEPLLNGLVSPFPLIEKVSRETTKRLRDFFFIRPDSRTDAEREAAVVSDADRSAAVTYWQRQLGSPDRLSPAQFDLLAKTITMLSRGGNKVIVVDLPVPNWWDAALPMNREYKDRLAAMERSFADDGAVKFVNLDRFNNSENFSDEVHAKPSIAKQIGQSVAKVINAETCDLTRQTHLLEGHH
ncbi:hypothetical protein [Methylobacterium persicinum]|uniref:SGNH/GDSL hydrolase family protein n=1 Tax=Methylobacterium persicinum TaxID=374426 RepID=A0ABU0HQA4_9HYPH|nr:hypothetical protein [Methylobacterium persicinum]MDQ0444504.1 hypothetical protein [Methylobacterium persicinum]GJE40400.1 hypothetical protein KHHGKMAE_4492 [Methylobacterium persicinum]